MKKTYTNCNPTICNEKDLMSDNGEFMTKEKIKEQCVCINKQVCLSIIELLSQNKKEEAEILVDYIQKNGQ